MTSPAFLLGVLFFGHMCTDIVQGSLPALLPFLKDRFDLSYAAAGSLLMAAHMTSSVIQPLFGYVTDRHPLPVLLALGCLVSGVGIALVPFSPSFGWLVAFVMFTGLGTAAFHPEGFKATACIVSERRATGMSFFSVGGNLGIAVGSPLAIFLVSRHGLRGASVLLLPAAAAALIFLPVLPAIRRRIHSVSAAPQANAMSDVKKPLYAVSLLILIVVMRSWTQLGLATYIPFLYKEKLASDPAYVATLLFLFFGAGTVGTLLGGPLADRFGHRRLLFVSTALQVPLLFVFLWSSGWLVFVMAALLGCTIVSTFAVTIVMAQEMFPRRMATASGAIAGFAIGTGGVGVTLLGVVADHYGVGAATHLINLLPATGAILALLLPLPWKTGDENGRGISRAEARAEVSSAAPPAS